MGRYGDAPPSTYLSDNQSPQSDDYQKTLTSVYPYTEQSSRVSRKPSPGSSSIDLSQVEAIPGQTHISDYQEPKSSSSTHHVEDGITVDQLKVVEKNTKKELQSIQDEIKQLEDSHKEEKAKREKEIFDLEHQLSREIKEIEILNKRYIDANKEIRIKDADYSTVNQEIQNLVVYRIQNDSYSLVNNEKMDDSDKVKQFFTKRWPELKQVIAELDKKQLPHFIRKLISETIINEIICQPIQVGETDLNEAYQNVSAWMQEQSAPDIWIDRLQKSLCTIVAESPSKAIQMAKSDVVAYLVDSIRQVFPKCKVKAVEQSMSQIVDAAVNVSMSIRQAGVKLMDIDHTLQTLDSKTMEDANKQTENGIPIKFVICPLFYKEVDGPENMVVSKARVFCQSKR